MTEHYAILSCDDKSNYIDFWPTVSFLWDKLIGVKPVLLLIGDENSDIYECGIGHGLVKKIKAVTGNRIFEAQVSRLYGPSMFPESKCIISDIDMLPLSREYFSECLSNATRSSFNVYSSDAYGETEKFPMCYNVASGDVFSEIFDIHDYESFIIKTATDFGMSWSTDEIMLYKKVHKYPFLQKYNRGWTGGFAARRIDRGYWKVDEKLVSDGYYIDCHSLRPFKNHEKEIEKIWKPLIS